MEKTYNIREIFELEEGTIFRTLTTKAMSDHESECIIKNGIVYRKVLGEWHSCLLTLNWLNKRFKKIDK